MVDPRNLQDDSDLNPANTDFDKKVNPTSETARKLGESEDRFRAPENFYEDAGKDRLRQARAKEWNAPENQFDYQKEERAKKSGAFRGMSGRRKMAIAGAGVGGLAGILLAITLLLGFKIPGIMSMITDEAGQRVEQITERRAKVIIARAIMQKFATTGDGVVITGGGPLSTLIASMRTNGMEKRLADKGITIEKNGKNVTVRTKQEVIFKGNGGDINKETEVLVQKLDGSKLGRQALRDIIKEDIPSWRLMKRMKFAKFLRLKYGIPRYGIPNSDKTDEDAAAKEMEQKRLAAEMAETSANAGEFVNCASGAECNLPSDDNPDAKLGSTAGQGDVKDTLSSAGDEATTEVTKNLDKESSKIMTDILSKKFAAKAIPVFGWIDLASMISHAVKSEAESNTIGKAVAGLKEANFAQLYGNWSGYASQNQLGALNPAYIKVLAKQTEGVEEGQAFNYINTKGNTTASTAFLSQTAYAASSASSSIPGIPVDRIDSNNPGVIQSKLLSFNDASSGVAGAFGKPTAEILDVWYNTVGAGGLEAKVGDFVSKGFLAVTPDAVEEWAGGYMKILWQKMLELFSLDFNPLVSGGKWFNNAHAGATASMNRFCHETGCRKLTAAQASIQNQTIAAEKADYIKQKGPLYALFSPDEKTSLTTQLAISTQPDMASNLSSMASFVMQTPSRLFGSLLPSAHAAVGYVDLYGVDPYGATDQDLSEPISDAVIKGGNDGEGCPQVADGDYNGCKVDTVVVDALLCEYEPDSSDCSDEDPATNTATGGAGSFTVASYNLLNSSGHPANSIDVGGCRTHPVPGDPTCAKTRAARQAEIITGQGVPNPQFDLVATQETSNEQYNALKSSLTGYGVFPNDPSRLTNSQDGATAMWWNKSKFTEVESGKYPGISNTSLPITAPWVGLQASSGQKIYFASIHYAIGAYGGTDASIKESSRLTMNWVKSKATGDNIVIVGGDFNDRMSQQNSYCVYTAGGLMQHAVDMAAGANPNAGCSANRFNSIDHIYATPKGGITASGWTHAPKSGIYSQSSDHTPVYVQYSFPGADGGTGAAGDWSWPVKKVWWDNDKADFLGAHTARGSDGTLTGTAWGADNMGTTGKGGGIAADIGDPPLGQPVFAMLGGTVTSTSLCNANDGIAIKSKVGNDTIGIAYMHGTNKRFKVGDSVKSGDQIMSLGQVGCNVYGAHVHIGIAYNGKYVCPQDVFIAMGAGKSPNLSELVSKGIPTCGR